MCVCVRVYVNCSNLIHLQWRLTNWNGHRHQQKTNWIWSQHSWSLSKICIQRWSKFYIQKSRQSRFIILFSFVDGLAPDTTEINISVQTEQQYLNGRKMWKNKKTKELFQLQFDDSLLFRSCQSFSNQQYYNTIHELFSIILRLAFRGALTEME